MKTSTQSRAMTMSPKFKTFADAEAAGYVRAGREREIEPGIVLADVDGCGLGPQGRAYAIRAWTGSDWVWVGKATIGVELSEERNRLGRPGCYACMFAPGEYDNALEEARKIRGTAKPRKTLGWRTQDTDSAE